ncbi:hypothetical protein [Streptomyces sp. NPDC005760]|uniref:hypothetical protein n=1 Tax=Streptomyces sp. NPDC005760 TaxID=3156718 RepID=UPI0033DF70B3
MLTATRSYDPDGDGDGDGDGDVDADRDRDREPGEVRDERQPAAARSHRRGPGSVSAAS